MVVTKSMEVPILAEAFGILGVGGLIPASGVHRGLNSVKGAARDGVPEGVACHIRTSSHSVRPIMMTTRAIQDVSSTETLVIFFQVKDLVSIQKAVNLQ